MAYIKEELAEKIKLMMHKPDYIRNIGIVAHIHHGKTTLSDNLLAAAGMISTELAGKQLYLNFDEQEQARCLTINSANVSIVHPWEGKEYLINLIDTPGHVDFGGDVTRAMRAVDGAVVLVCAVEGVMAQTETVLRQALREKVKPVLFISKVDRAINELKLSPEMLQTRFKKIIEEVNELIRKMVPEEFKDKWFVNVNDGSVAFGSAYHNWALSVPYMLRTGVKFKDIIDLCSQGRQKELAERAKINDVVFDMVVKHLPNPLQAQRYRIPQIWKGDLESEVGRAMTSVDKSGPLAFMITDITIDEHAGEIATGRVFSGRIVPGEEYYICGTNQRNKCHDVAVFMGPQRLMIPEGVVAGNIAAVTGLRSAVTGNTISSVRDMEPFEEIRHVSEPVVTVAIEAKQMKDLPKLVEVLRKVSKEDASLRVEINQETGENLLSGMGELHIEITVYRIVNDHKVDVVTSKPIVVYRECVAGRGGPFEGKSPNKHNRFYLQVEPLPDAVVRGILDGEIPSDTKIKDQKALAKKLQELGLSKEEAKAVVSIHTTNILLDMTKGIQYLHETMELIIDGFKEAMDRGPLAAEKVRGLKVSLMDAKLHEDSIHRGPAQVIPAVRSSIYGAMCQAGRVLLEPMVKVTLNVPDDIVGNVNRELLQRRNEIQSIEQVGDLTTITTRAPVAAMFGFASSIRSASGGRVLWGSENVGYQRVPPEMSASVVAEVRTRKGLKPEPYDEAYYAA
ncbi:MAG: elongation factor EF-2 [Thermoplasmatota archaeon]